MSDSDDDWFEKDIDDIVQEVQKKKESLLNNAANSFEDAQDHETATRPREFLNYAFSGDYGGNYELPTSSNHGTKSSQSKLSRQNSDKGGGFVQTISFKKLNFVAEMNPLNTFLEITQKDCGFFEILQDDLSEDYVMNAVKVFSNLCELPINEHKKIFFQAFAQKAFLKRIEKVVNNKLKENVVTKTKKLFQMNFHDFIGYLMSVCKDAARFVAESSDLKIFIENLQTVFKNVGKKYSKELLQLENIRSLITERLSESSNQVEIYPTPDELLKPEDTDILQPIITKGKYQSVQHYLEIHSVLLREDFISPLRDLIAELKSFATVDEIPKRKLYKKVRLVLSDESNSKNRKGEMLMVDLKPDERDFEIQKIPSENAWIGPNKFMYGSLLIFTTSLEFKDMILAIVSHRDIESIQRGFVQIEIVKIFGIMKIFNNDFLMLESEVFFEPYHYVYRILKNLDEENFPMQNFIVDIDNTPFPPDYLTASKSILYVRGKSSFNPLKYDSYPPPKSLRFDESQLNAYRHALSRKFSLIQGPPGTGKTYIGQEIVSTLLDNIDAQILIICFTNHALDQFLMGITNMTEDIVRMGNQSKHEVLDKYNVKQMSDATITDRRLKACFYHTKIEYSQKMGEFEQLQRANDNTEQSYEKILQCQNELRIISRKLDELKQISDHNLIKDKKIIGMTTSCAARCNLLLQLLKAPIVIIEEASEVLETHIVASLTKDTQHVILIGDHQQLRPKTSVYKLREKCKTDISLFERMLNNNINCVCLSTQHRMRPEIADLLRPEIYPNLLDHSSVENYENVRGIAKNMFFVNHDAPENKFKDESTKWNIAEAQFLLALGNYLIIQGYKQEDLVILTAYNGQMVQLYNERKQYPNLHKVRLAVVDNFQGEESKIILLSLVRSNEENRIGYLSMKNRICVLLSRAREGFYAIGNIEMLAENSETWKAIKEKLELKEAIGDDLPLKCNGHGNILKMHLPKDFDQVRFGGCHEQCDFIFSCGHVCGYMCHCNAFEHRPDCDCRSN